MNKLIYILFIIGFTNSLHSQISVKDNNFKADTFYSQINSNINTLQFIALVNSSDSIVKRILVYNNANRLIQEIYVTNQFDPPFYKDYLEFEDINCDNYKDLLLQIWRGGTGNEGSDVWLFNPEGNQFVLNDFLSDLPGISVDCDTKTISSWHRDSARDNIIRYYQIINNEFRLVGETEDIWDRDNNKITTVKRVNKDGKMIEISRTIKDDD